MTTGNAGVNFIDTSSTMYIDGKTIVSTPGSGSMYLGTTNSIPVSIGSNDTEVVKITTTTTEVTTGSLRVTSMNNNNYMITTDGDGDFISESNLTFDGSELNVNGDVDCNRTIYDQISLSSGAYGDVATYVAGENLVAGDVCYKNSSGHMQKASSNGAGTYPALALCLETINSASSGLFLKRGHYYHSSHGLTIGNLLWLSDTAGDYTDTAPSTSNYIAQILGSVTSANKIEFDPSKDYLTIN